MIDGDLASVGWEIRRHVAGLAAWVEAVRPAALATLDDPAHAAWMRCGGTWFAGVDCLANDADGRVGDGPSLPPGLLDVPLHRAQLSAVFPGYPQAMEGEGPGAARYRLTRDAAHVDGLLPEGPQRRRHLREPHSVILGLPLTDTSPDASPLVVWEGSHHIMRATFADAFDGRAPDDWGAVDVTDVYHTARHRVFESCHRRELPARPGDAVFVHRLTLHGIAPWRAPQGPPRVVAYFRPQGPIREWLD